MQFLGRVSTALALAWAAVSGAAVAPETESAIRAGLATVRPDLQAEAIRETPVAGLYEVVIGDRVVYISGDGRYLLQGELVDIESDRSLTEPRRREVRRAALSRLPESTMIVFPATGETQQEITVFTDVDCPYCQRFHGEVPRLNAAGVTVRYVFFPLTGKEAYTKAVRVWCADDRPLALTRAKAGETIRSSACDHPLEAHLALARALAVRGTPTIVTADGEIYRRYLAADELLQRLAVDSANAARAAGVVR